MPAQFTTTSSLLWFFSISAITFFTSSSLVTLAGMNVAFSPISLATLSPSDVGRSQNTTLAPFLAKRAAVARPSPDAPPVTSVTKPCKLTFLYQFVSNELLWSFDPNIWRSMKRIKICCTYFKHIYCVAMESGNFHVINAIWSVSTEIHTVIWQYSSNCEVMVCFDSTAVRAACFSSP